MTDSQKLIAEECDALKALLLEKNRKYGDSVLNPKRIFSSADSTEQIKVRIDDKLSRLANLQPDEHEDVVLDLLGYLILLRVATRKNEQVSTPKTTHEQNYFTQPGLRLWILTGVFSRLGLNSALGQRSPNRAN
ncbi:MAG: hypothetical protein E6R03_10820 [Hyphomicrobiaceae bacterium]|nr:MAG: hypothetical protein E6R03_10820 [Hyphomicrobiaceae bacterium]